MNPPLIDLILNQAILVGFVISLLVVPQVIAGVF